jgi:hypothetical protein
MQYKISTEIFPKSSLILPKIIVKIFYDFEMNGWLNFEIYVNKVSWQRDWEFLDGLFKKDPAPWS